jgi:hypothetical protein
LLLFLIVHNKLCCFSLHSLFSKLGLSLLDTLCNCKYSHMMVLNITYKYRGDDIQLLVFLFYIASDASVLCF